jgi:GMP synthase (glutamine-hydrolysing)
MDELRALVRGLVDEEVPTLGVCFGHQLVNDALDGRVEHRGLRKGIETLRFADDPLVEAVGARVPMVHGDFVTELGDGTKRIATAGYYENLGSRHRDAPLWTVQYHPEFTAALLPRIEADFGRPTNDSDRDFDGVSVERTLANFVRLAIE